MGRTPISSVADVQPRSPHAWDELPKSCHKVPAHLETEFALRLWRAGMGVFLPEDDLLVTDCKGKQFVPAVGWCCVCHQTMKSWPEPASMASI